MEHPAGESDDGSLRVDFDRRLKLEFHWTRLSCRRFASNAVRLQLDALAYNLAHFLRTPTLPEAVSHWFMTTLRDRLIVSHRVV